LAARAGGHPTTAGEVGKGCPRLARWGIATARDLSATYACGLLDDGDAPEASARGGVFTISDGNFRNFLDFGGVRKIYVSEINIFNINYIIFVF
jgi:hypothetical protein